MAKLILTILVLCGAWLMAPYGKVLGVQLLYLFIALALVVAIWWPTFCCRLCPMEDSDE